MNACAGSRSFANVGQPVCQSILNIACLPSCRLGCSQSWLACSYVDESERLPLLNSPGF